MTDQNRKAEITRSLVGLFMALPPRKGNPEELTAVYEMALRECSTEALKRVAGSLIRGELNGASRSFAPTPAELAYLVRNEGQAIKSALERTSYQPIAFVGLQMRIDAARQRMEDEGREKLADIDYAAMLSRSKEFPPGSLFVALLGAVYGPKSKNPLLQPNHGQNGQNSRETEKIEDFQEP